MFSVKYSPVKEKACSEPEITDLGDLQTELLNFHFCCRGTRVWVHSVKNGISKDDKIDFRMFSEIFKFQYNVFRVWITAQRIPLQLCSVL